MFTVEDEYEDESRSHTAAEESESSEAAATVAAAGRNDWSLWWQKEASLLVALASKRGPLFVYSESALLNAVERFKSLRSFDRLFFAIEANSNADVLGVFEAEGLGFRCASLAEVKHLIKLFPHMDRKRINFMPTFAPRKEYAKALEVGVHVTVDNPTLIHSWGRQLFQKKEIMLNLDLALPTNGRAVEESETKLGMSVTELHALKEQLEAIHCKVVGLQTNVGGSSLENGVDALEKVKVEYGLDDVRYIVVSASDLSLEQESEGDVLEIDRRLLEAKQRVRSSTAEGCPVEFCLESSRFLATKGGAFVCRVSQTMWKNGHWFVGLESAMNILSAPAFHDGEHAVFNLSRLKSTEPKCPANIVGPTYDSRDKFGRHQMPVGTQENEIVLVADVGVYGFTASNYFNMREPAKEYFLAAPRRQSFL